jgi:uncharacterized DUF497 family protein
VRRNYRRPSRPQTHRDATDALKFVYVEQVFFNKPILVTSDPGHSEKEERLFAPGKTDVGRRRAVVFVIRGESLRAISARPMSRQERRIYG